MTTERLQKSLARAGVGSRRKVEELIREGRITVNGHVAELGQQADLAVDSVKVDGKRIRPVTGKHRYVLLNKPRASVSTLEDPEGRTTILELLPQRLRPGLKPVGRLDYDTEGLILLTDDGELAHHVAHPRFGCTKTYEVKVRGRPTEDAIERLRGGVFLDGKRTAPATISALQKNNPRSGGRGGGPKRGPRELSKNSWWEIILNEGRTRQIREMFLRIGHSVQRLRRVAIGPIRDPGLQPGNWRELEPREVTLLQKRYEKPKPKGRTPKGRTPKGRTPKGRGPGGPTSTKGRPSRGRTPKGRVAGGRTPKGRPPKGGRKPPRRGHG